MRTRLSEVDESTVGGRIKEAGPVNHRGLRQSATLVACLLALTGCSVNDTLRLADAQQGLRDRAHTIRGLAEEAVATGSTRTGSSLAAEVIGQIPSEPDGEVLTTNTAQDPVRVDVGVALVGKADNYGPGGGTHTLRLCVLYTAVASPAPEVTMADLACPPGMSTVDQTVHLT